MNGLALITDMEYIKVGNRDYTQDGRKLSSRHLAYIPKGNVLTEGLLTEGLLPLHPIIELFHFT